MSHIAAVLPARGITRLPLAGLAAGAMSPDLEYLFQAGTSRSVSHDPIGVLLLDVPLALLALGLASLASPGLASLVPARWPAVASWLREWRPPWSSPAAFAWLLLAIVIGAINHIAVDAFTHGGSWGVEVVPSLNQQIAFAGRWLPAYRWLQYGLSVVGMAVVVMAIHQWFRTVQPRPSAATTWIEPRKNLVLLSLMGLATLAALHQATTSLGMPGFDKTTAVVLLLAGVRAGGLMLVGMGTVARGMTLLGRSSSA